MRCRSLVSYLLLGSFACAQTEPVQPNTSIFADFLAAIASEAMPPEGRKATVQGLWVDSKRHEGGTNPITVRVTPNDTAQVSVGIMEAHSGATAADWKAAAWIAAFTASQVTDHLITEHTFLVQSGTHIGGPSAGMLMTATMVALIRGDEVRSDATMTGTINPDGSIGPVGGITHKLSGAHASGIKSFGFPVGQRLSPNGKTKTLDDLIKKAEDLGMEAVEVKDIYDAYRLLTGKDLPRPAPVDEGKMTPSVALGLRLREAVDRRLATAEKRSLALDEKFVNEAKRMVSQAGKAPAAEAEANAKNFLTSQRQVLRSAGIVMQLAEKFKLEGDLVVALYYSQMADSQTRVDEVLYEVKQHWLKDDIKSYALAIDNQIKTAAASLEKMRPLLTEGLERTTVGGRIDALQCFLNYWTARAVRLASDFGSVEREEALEACLSLKKQYDQLSGELSARKSITASQKQALDEIRADLLSAQDRYNRMGEAVCRDLAMAQGMAENSAEWTRLAPEDGPPVGIISTEFYELLGKSYSSAAAAALQWFNAMYADEQVKTETDALNSRSNSVISSEKVKRALIMREPEWGPVDRAANFSEFSSTFVNKEKLLPMDQLASGLYAFIGCASLINKHYNFNGNAIPGAPFWLSNRKALRSTLDYARKRVLEECGRLDTEIGYIPDAIKINFELANALRDGQDAERLSALKAYWKCNFLCDMARRFVSPPPPSKPEQ